jgi:hypothetical protein
MTKYSLLQSAIVAAAVALFVPAFCVPVEGGENSTSIIPALAPAIELNTRSILNKRGSSFVNVGAASCFQGAFVHKYVNEKVRHETQERTSRTRFTAINETPEPLWIWIEIRIGDDTFRVPDPDATWTQKIKIDPGESVQVGNIPIHSGNIRAYARCNENGVQCAGDEGTATKWEWTTEPEPDKTPNTAGINLSLGTSITPTQS